MKPTSEQIKEFWEKCGFKSRLVWSDPADIGGRHQFKVWDYPDGNGVTQHLSTNPPIDLNNLFKYAVKEDWEIHFYFDNCSQTHDCVITMPNEKEYDGSGNTRKDALFWALWEVIHEG